MVHEWYEIAVMVVFNVCIFVLFLTRNSLMLLIKASYKNVHVYSYSYYNKSGFILDSQGK